MRWLRFVQVASYGALVVGFVLFIVHLLGYAWGKQMWLLYFEDTAVLLVTLGLHGAIWCLQCDVAIIVARRQVRNYVKRLAHGQVWLPGSLALEEEHELRAFLSGKRYRLILFLLASIAIFLSALVVCSIIMLATRWP